MLIVLENIENNTSGSREFATYLANNHSKRLAGAGA